MTSGLKIVLIGDSGVGKTAIYQRFESDTFTEDHQMTIGAAFARFQITLESGSNVDVGIWDTAGQEKYRNVVPMYFQRANYVFLVYDVSDRNTFTALEDWNTMIKDKAPESAKVILIGNKSDLENDRQVSYDEGAGKATAFECQFVETSAKTGSGIELLTNLVAKDYEESIAVKTTPQQANVTNQDEAGITNITGNKSEEKRGCC